MRLDLEQISLVRLDNIKVLKNGCFCDKLKYNVYLTNERLRLKE